MSLASHGVSRSYSATEVLRPLSMEVPSGEFLTLLGPSGSAKTTVLRLSGGIAMPTGRRISFYGADITQQPPNGSPRDIAGPAYFLCSHDARYGTGQNGSVSGVFSWAASFRRNGIHQLAKVFHRHELVS